jgi:acetyl/propionyl-CoA carboxylase alpha subunit
MKGAAVECRVNAEDPLRRFLPSSGIVRRLRLPTREGIRVDSSLYQGCEVSVFYDSLIVKVIAHADSLEEAREAVVGALGEFEIEGLASTIPLQQELLSSDEFKSWDLSTDFIARNDILDRLAAIMEEQREGEARARADLASQISDVYAPARV